MRGEVQGEREEKRERAANSESKGKKDSCSMKKKALVTIVIIQIVLTLNYVPFMIALALEGKLPHYIYKCEIAALALAAASCCTYLQPLLYLKKLGKLPFMKPRNM